MEGKLVSWFSSKQFGWVLVFAYVLSFGLTTTFPSALFWDDWAYGQTFKTYLPVRPEQAGDPWWANSTLGRQEIEWVLSLLPGGVRLFQFILVFPLIALVATQIVRTSFTLPAWAYQAFFGAHLLAPVYSARVARITFNYSLSYLIFLFGWWCLDKWLNEQHLGRNGRRVLYAFMSILALAFSFRTRSLIPFALMIPLTSVFSNRPSTQVVKSVLISSASVLVAVLLASLPPILAGEGLSGSESYNELTIAGLFRAIALSLLGVVFVALVLHRRLSGLTGFHRLFAFGVLSTCLGLFGYLAVGHFYDLQSFLSSFVPRESDWYSRHQLLMPLGFASLFVVFLHLVRTSQVRTVFILVTAGMVILNVSISSEYRLDALKQSSLLSQIDSKERDLKQFSQFVVIDNAELFNARGRLIRGYEFEAMLRRVLRRDDIRAERYLNVLFDPSLLNPSKPTALLAISSGRGRLATHLQNEAVIDLAISSHEFP